MLVAELDGQRIEARDAVKGSTYLCPNPDCRSSVTLKQGKTRIAHFAHQAAACDWSKGETAEHREAKLHIASVLRERGLQVEIECFLPHLAGDRRADVLVTRPNKRRLAIELQHSPLPLDILDARMTSYARQGITQIWIPFLPKDAIAESEEVKPYTRFIRRYTPKKFEKRLYELTGTNGIFMYEPEAKQFWLAHWCEHMLYKPANEYGDSSGNVMYGGGYEYASKRWYDLTLTGPADLEILRFKTLVRAREYSRDLKWPGGKIATLIVDAETSSHSPRPPDTAAE